MVRIKLSMMKIDGPLIKGKLLSRPNRFTTHIQLDCDEVISHLPDPGRLQELLVHEATVFVRPVAEDAQRKTRFSTVMVEHKGILISLNSTLPNRFVKEDFNTIPLFDQWQLINSEVKIGNHRIDFLLKDQYGQNIYTEVKSVTFVEEGIAKFPDAVTERGKRHAKLLSEMAISGQKTMILFVVQRPDAEEFQPMWDRDPSFSRACLNAERVGVLIKCITVNVSRKEMTFYKEIPVTLHPPHEQ